MKKEWKAFLKTLVLRDYVTPGALGIVDFAERAGVHGASVIKALKTGKIPREYCFCTLRNNGTRLIWIDWDRAGYDYIVNRHPRTWPKDFAPNPEKMYKPIGDSSPSPESSSPPPGASAPQSEASAGALSPPPPSAPPELPEASEGAAKTQVLADYKIRAEALKVQKMEIEVQQIRAELIPRAEVLAINRELALDLRAALFKMGNQVVPAIQAAGSVIKGRAIFRDHLKKTIDALKDLEDENYAKATRSSQES